MSGFTLHNKSPLFKISVDKLLSNWRALEIAVHNGQGGAFGKEIASWMRDVVEDFFYQNDDLDGDEVADFLNQIMNQELDTIVEDNSSEELGAALVTHFRLATTATDLSNAGKLGELHAELDAAAASRVGVPLPKPEPEENSDSDEDMETEENGVVNGNASSEPMPNRSSQPDEDGWVTVKSKKR